ncbi:heme o synthase [Leucobacter chromiireducens]|uniref:Protoheme IX farnesyltransferase n=1 Tax=Leucobacter chromiireducens subsp. solipictus TaxID=398235 RepID=A0ABS1SJD0_9MICO|nr:heme o synthase [Leucobacter chromiireducens]MBL3679589.1 protoheme IX farnesyltransferase [Leucobacter chromiireducens subsp. solipictus]
MPASGSPTHHEPVSSVPGGARNDREAAAAQRDIAPELAEIADAAVFSERSRGTDAKIASRADGDSLRATIARYYSLTKPGVLYGNVLTAAAGFLLATGVARHFDVWLFLTTIVGTTFVIAAACVLNNVLDRDIDDRMERTKKRATVSGSISVRGAVIFSIVLFVLGNATLIAWTNWLVVVTGLAGFFTYVVLYGMLSKRMSVHGTLVGSVSGAAPIFAGYVAVTGVIDAGAIFAFLAIFFWQMPEFYSIAVYRRDEYARAGVPVITVVKGIPRAKVEILIYTIAYAVVSVLLTPFGYTGWVYAAVMGALGLWWVIIGIQGFRATDDSAWARRMFRFSLIIIMAYSLMISVGPLLP